ncbi:unnamed protein product [Heligmosomoides polygyrus]|uniref:PX domain-containing protein n=1 Tax=Heligmosomoides polygyrus TaxID=6339 RepID=A0A183GGJ9_HELPZ|nr:unnamed protein product [Heligmosomoides polygyrus]
MSMRLSQLVAKELHLLNYIETPATVSLNGVTSFELKSGFITYRVFLVQNNDEEKMTVAEASKLAAFYNSKFFHETVTNNHLAIPCGHFERSFRIEDDGATYLVFVVRIENGRRKLHLSEGELGQFLRVIGENHEIIRRYQVSMEPKLVGILKEAIQGELAQYFSLPAEVVPRLEAVLQHEEHCAEPPDRSLGEVEHEVVDISEWENVHFGDVALDLSYLIISSAEPSVRRNKYMTIFRRYYYARVDRRPTSFPLADLKRLFRKHHKRAVILGIEPLLEILTSSVDEEMKRAHSYRWESALEDAYNFTTVDYVSDNEHCLFSK